MNEKFAKKDDKNLTKHTNPVYKIEYLGDGRVESSPVRKILSKIHQLPRHLIIHHHRSLHDKILNTTKPDTAKSLPPAKESPKKNISLNTTKINPNKTETSQKQSLEKIPPLNSTEIATNKTATFANQLPKKIPLKQSLPLNETVSNSTENQEVNKSINTQKLGIGSTNFYY